MDDKGYLVLTDFGLCKEDMQGSKTTSTFCGTPEYLAPEIILKKPYDKTVDWWCLGSVLYEMIFGMGVKVFNGKMKAAAKLIENTVEIQVIIISQL